ncbi:MAG: GH116 family glycosyl hydrolase, partial [Microbacterium sp.]
STWDADGDGLLRGIQPSTHDIDLAGVNPFMGTLWLAALRAYEELALLLGQGEAAAEARERFESGSKLSDELLFNGAQYIQTLDEDDPRDFQWLSGTLSDQVIGQWWAHQLGLGHVFPQEHVRAALRHVVATNLRTGFVDFDHPYRVYADAADDTGVLMCSWPDGGRPAVPTRYADEGHAVLDGLYRRYSGARASTRRRACCTSRPRAPGPGCLHRASAP